MCLYVFEVTAVLGTIKCDSPKTTSFSRTINHQIILVSCMFLSGGDVLEYWKVSIAARLKWFIFLQQPCGPHFSSPSSFSFSCNFHGCTGQGPASKTSERFRGPVSEAKCLRPARGILILFTYIIVNFPNNLHNPPSSCCMPTNAVISPCCLFCLLFVLFLLGFGWFLFFFFIIYFWFFVCFLVLCLGFLLFMSGVFLWFWFFFFNIF